MSKTFRLNDSEYSMIMSALDKLAMLHFEKSKELKREADVQFHKEKFQTVMNVKFELREQMKGQENA